MLHDKDIRDPLFDYLEETHGKIRIIEEKNMGESRADVVMICPESITGIEIKSDADTYTRLEGQIRAASESPRNGRSIRVNLSRCATRFFRPAC